VKADDFGLRLSQVGRSAALRALGVRIVHAMPKVMSVISIVGTAAMLWVGGSIVIHGLDELGWPWLYDTIHHAAEAAAHAVAQAEGFVSWAVTAALDGLAGLVLGVALIPAANWVIAPVVRLLRGKGAA
jgi:predicted DNA repair protein MutK